MPLQMRWPQWRRTPTRAVVAKLLQSVLKPSRIGSQPIEIGWDKQIGKLPVSAVASAPRGRFRRLISLFARRIGQLGIAAIRPDTPTRVMARLIL